MDTDNSKKEDIINLAKKTKHYCDLLIEQSDSWLSEEEGMRNIEKKMSASVKKNKYFFCRQLSRIFSLSLITFFFYLAFPEIALGQNTDSLYYLFYNADKADKVLLGNEICSLAFEREVVSDEWRFTNESKEDHIFSRVFFCMSRFASANADYNAAVEYTEKGLEIDLKNNDLKMLASDYHNLATIYQNLNLFEKSLPYYEQCLEVVRSIGDKEREANTLYDMGLFYLRRSRDGAGLKYIENALEIALRNNLKKIVAQSYGTIGEYHLKFGNAEKAMDAILKSLEACREIGTPFYLEAGLCRLGMAQVAVGEYEKAEKNLLEALKMSFLLEDKSQTAFDYMALGDLKVAQKMVDSADYYYNLCIAKSVELDDFTLQSVVYDKLYQLHRRKNPVLSLEYLEKGIIVDDSLYNLDVQDQISSYQVKFDTQEKELEIVRQQSQLSKQKLRLIIIIISFSLSLLILLLLWRMLNLRTKRNRVLSEMNTTKDKFLSIISHDLKNPAIAQRDALKLLIDNSAVWDVALLSQYYDELLRSADSNVELLYNLLNWAQVQTGRMPYKPVTFDLVSALHSDIALIENMSKQKGVIFNVEMPESAIVTGDNNMITVIVRNLLTNALKFTSADESVTLCVELMNNGNTSIVVSDTGIGMSCEQICNLFVLDNKQSRRGTNGESGNGLGLIVCKEMVEKHGSTLYVESRVGEGSRFWFEIN